jgi:hypothetical protein
MAQAKTVHCSGELIVLPLAMKQMNKPSACICILLLHFLRLCRLLSSLLPIIMSFPAFPGSIMHLEMYEFFSCPMLWPVFNACLCPRREPHLGNILSLFMACETFVSKSP